MNVIASEPKVIVYRFKVYDGTKDDFVLSARYATKEQIDQIGAVVVGDPHEISATDVKAGFTDRGYNPQP